MIKKLTVVKENYNFKVKPYVLFKGSPDDLTEDTKIYTLSKILYTGSRWTDSGYSEDEIQFYGNLPMKYIDTTYDLKEEALMSLNIEDPNVELINFTKFNSFSKLNRKKLASSSLSSFNYHLNHVFSLSKEFISWLEKYEPEALEEVEIEINN